MLSFGNLVVNPVHFLLTENMKRGYQGIILLFKSSEIDKLKKQGVVRHQICFNAVANFL
jgi:hypothetical protein